MTNQEQPDTLPRCWRCSQPEDAPCGHDHFKEYRMHGRQHDLAVCASVGHTFQPPTPDTQSGGGRFRELIDRWHREIGGQSNPNRILAHTAAREIVSMGDAAVPLLIGELKRGGGGAEIMLLGEIVGERPFPPEDAGHVEKMERAWLDWYDRRTQSGGRPTVEDALHELLKGGTWKGVSVDELRARRQAVKDAASAALQEARDDADTAWDQVNGWERRALAAESTIAGLRERHEQEMDAVLRERDEREEWADRLAYAIAPVEEIGEHSSSNNPWQRALDFLETGVSRNLAQAGMWAARAGLATGRAEAAEAEAAGLREQVEGLRGLLRDAAEYRCEERGHGARLEDCDAEVCQRIAHALAPAAPGDGARCQQCQRPIVFGSGSVYSAWEHVPFGSDHQVVPDPAWEVDHVNKHVVRVPGDGALPPDARTNGGQS